MFDADQAEAYGTVNIAWADENGAQFEMDNQRSWPDTIVTVQDVN